MHHIIGLYTSKKTERLWLLDPHDQIIFRTDCFHSFGYFSLIAPAFEKYAQRDAGISITSINVKFCLRSDDLDEALEVLNDLEIELYQQPTSWWKYLGETQYPRQPLRPIQPLLFRGRAFRLIHKLRALVLKAQAQEKCLVYGNGVLYRSLRGIKMPPGVVVYS
ncbi:MULTISPECIES: hypothetical protein [Pseudomonas]|uniref:hypothetical protein n=1 Tax=Pseudomonas TaxID=286 RepID=UPI0009D9F137|nr:MULTISPECIES: hypothetical protein [Pseudomonas]WDH25649.1 hypothetical protein PUP50_15665 [Pseudomonas chlororaphis]WIE47441.1 hypothetical protein PMI20_016790 [Pseudomonas sp. GM17]